MIHLIIPRTLKIMGRIKKLDIKLTQENQLTSPRFFLANPIFIGILKEFRIFTAVV